MTVATEFVSWQSPKPAWYVKFRKASPNLVALCDSLIKRWDGTNIGIYGKRPIRGGSDPSSHSFGAALDWKYPTKKAGTEAMAWLIANSEELGIQAVHDYVGCRIWRAGRGWKKQKVDEFGMGQAWGTWLHIETLPSRWADATPIEHRGVSLPS